MSVSTRNPLRLVGANLNSGFPNTGEQMATTGGTQSASIYSGQVVPGLTAAYNSVGGNPAAVGSDVIFYSGAGRLKSVMPHTQLSGVAIVFYDANAAVSGGPIYTSGHKVLAVIPANTFGGGPGQQIFGAGPTLYQFDQPFFSGLVYNSRSGQPGVTVSWIPENNPPVG